MLIGNCTRDPELKYTPKGTAVAQLGLAVNRTYSTESGEKREECTFIDVELFGRTAELAGEYLKKGRPVFIEGRLKLDQWDDKQTGQKRSKLKIIGEQMQFLGSKEGGDERPAQGQQQRKPASTPPARQKPAPDPDLDAPDDDLAF